MEQHDRLPVVCIHLPTRNDEFVVGDRSSSDMTAAAPRVGEFLSAPFFCFGPLRRRTLASDCGQFLWGQVRRPRLSSLRPPARPPREPSATAAAFFPPGWWPGSRWGWERTGCRSAATSRRGDQLAGWNEAVAGGAPSGRGPGFTGLETGAETLGFVFVAVRHAEEHSGLLARMVGGA